MTLQDEESPSQTQPKEAVVYEETVDDLISSSKDASTGTPRLIITEMVLNNFKSYAGRQKIGPFHKSFTAIVGPNGSGKSNVIDALLFVFGYRASKMRQGKLSELIHNSSHISKPDSCSVEIHFARIIDAERDDFEFVPQSQLKVSRIAYRNNTSKYTVNDKMSSFTEVTTLLKSHGIDLDHKRFLILQGEVESIAQMKAKAANEHDDGLLEYLEDIIGTSKYKQPIVDASQLIETLNEDRSSKMVRLKIVEEERDALETKKHAAEAYINSLNRLLQLQNKLYQIFFNDCQVNIDDASSTMNDLSAQLEDLKKEHADASAQTHTCEDEYKKLLHETEGDSKEANSLAGKIEKLNRELIRLEEQAKHLKTKRQKLQKSNDGDQTSIQFARNALMEATTEIEKDQCTLSDLKRELEEAEAAFTSTMQAIKSSLGDLSDLLESESYALDELKASLARVQSTKMNITNEIDMLKQKSAGKDAEIQSAEEALEAMTKELEHETTRHKQSETERDSERSKCQVLLQERAEKEEDSKLLRLEISSLKSKVEDSRSSKASQDARSRVLQSLHALKESGRVKGIYDRLGNLGIIDEKYDIAVTTAASALNHIVVDTVETGTQCIEFLRANRLGRAQFICLDKLNIRVTTSINSPEGVPRLFDLIKPMDPKFSRAFYFALQDTLVVEDLVQANRIAYGKPRWRVVTLKGELIDKSGTMSGGGVAPLRGGMSSFKGLGNQTSSKDISAIEARIAKHEDTLKAYNSRLEELTVEIAEVEKMVRTHETEISKSGINLNIYSQKMHEFQRQLSELRLSCGSQTQEDSARIKSLTKEEHDLSIEEASIMKKVDEKQKLVDDLQEKILEKGGTTLRAQKSKLDGLKDRIQVLYDRVDRNEVCKAKAQKELLRFEGVSSSSASNMKSLDSEIETLEADINSKTLTLTDLKSKFETYEESRDEVKTQLKDLKLLLDAKRTVINECRNKMTKLKHQIDDINKVVLENKHKSKHWRQKLDQLGLTAKENCCDQELAIYSADDLSGLERDNLKAEIAVIEEELQNSKPNLGVLEEYRRRQEDYILKTQELESLTGQRDEAKTSMDALRKKRLEEFTAGFAQISLKLKEMYQMITLGGNAELEFVDSLDPFSEGITFSVMPPKKSWKNISNLSGGEKTLSSLALVFALHHYKPTPLYVMDEIDAALDFRNVSIIANYIMERTKDAQFIIISLRNNMFELSQRLVGIYKTSNQTKSITVENVKRDKAVIV